MIEQTECTNAEPKFKIFHIFSTGDKIIV